MNSLMRNFGYYTDFLVFPAVLLGLASATHRYGGVIHPIDGVTAFTIGIVFWSFLEYSIHRFILHNGLMFSADHDAHHAEPKAMIGTPTWLTLSIMVTGIYLPAVAAMHLGLGLIFGSGVTLGYLVYSFAHYILHHWNIRNDGLFYTWKRIHALHHFANQDANFGVTSTFWDHVFRTAAVPRSWRGWLNRPGSGQARP